MTMNDNSMPEKSSRKCFYSGAALLIVTLVAGAIVGGYFLFEKRPDEKLDIASVQNSSIESCHLTVKDSHQPILEFTLAAEHSETVVTDTEAKEFEQVIMDAYNDVSGGCSDEFKRWMYGISIVDQTVVQHDVLEREAESSISHTFDNEYSLVLRVETLVSCDGCTDDVAFASDYPETFGNMVVSERKLGAGFAAGNVYNAIENYIEQSWETKLSKVTLMTSAGSQIQHMSYYAEPVQVRSTQH